MANLSLVKPVFISLLVGSIVAGMTSFSFLEEMLLKTMIPTFPAASAYADILKITLNSAQSS